MLCIACYSDLPWVLQKKWLNRGNWLTNVELFGSGQFSWLSYSSCYKLVYTNLIWMQFTELANEATNTVKEGKNNWRKKNYNTKEAYIRRGGYWHCQCLCTTSIFCLRTLKWNLEILSVDLFRDFWEGLFIGGLIGHEGKDSSGYEMVHGGRGLWHRIKWGDMILDFCNIDYDNKYTLKKWDGHLTFKSGWSY